MQKQPTTRQKAGRSVQSSNPGKGPVGKRAVKMQDTRTKQKRGDRRMNPSSH